jgi:invasion protein IalB
MAHLRKNSVLQFYYTTSRGRAQVPFSVSARGFPAAAKKERTTTFDGFGSEKVKMPAL